MDEKNIQICSEIYCLLNYFPEAYIYKLPKKLLNVIKQNIYSKYFIEVDVNKPLEEQKIIKETKDTLIVLKYNYWSDETEKRNIIEQLNENEKKYEEELREKFNPDNLFKNRVSKVETIESSVAMLEYKESFFTKIRNWFKRKF
jgi:hypothetical protein